MKAILITVILLASVSSCKVYKQFTDHCNIYDTKLDVVTGQIGGCFLCDSLYRVQLAPQTPAKSAKRGNITLK